MLEAAPLPLPTLPEELIGEILLRLPVRSLLQFKSVCKSWKFVISGSQFIKSHVRISTITNQQLVFSFGKQPWEILSYPLKPLFENPSNPVEPYTFTYSEERFHRIIGSCNGLLCLLDTFPNCGVTLCNPSLRFISKNSSEPISEDWFMMNWFMMNCGFGYDQVNDKYKALLVVRCKRPDHGILTKLYTFGQDDSWKTIPNFPYDDPLLMGKFVSGTLNWIVSHKNYIISFDIEKETYMKISLPQNNSDNKLCTYRELSVLGDSLCVCDYFKYENSHLVVWLMKEYGVVESLIKFMVIPYDPFIRNPPRSRSSKPFFISENGVLMVTMDFEIILCNSNTAFALDRSITMELGMNPHIYCESFVSLPCYR